MSDFTDAVEAHTRMTVKLMEDKKALKAKVARLEARIAALEAGLRHCQLYGNKAIRARARAALTEEPHNALAGINLEPRHPEPPEEPYADIPGAGQRECG